MREILFRGKRVDNGEWVEGCGFADEGYLGKIFFYHDTFTDEEGTEHLFYDNIRVHTDTVGQYTGLQDKNGKKIFEGDIVEYQFDDDYPIYIGVVEFGKHCIKYEYNAFGWFIEIEDKNYYRYLSLEKKLLFKNHW